MLRTLFISRDDYNGDIINPLSMNKYAYCEENPLKYKDPSGNIPLNIAGIVIGAGGGAMLGTAVADYYKLTGYKRNLTIAGFAVGGAAVGWFAGPLVNKLALKIAVKMQVASWGLNGANNRKPLQKHHFLTNKSKTFTKQFKNITDKYGLDLDDIWNKELMPHQGRHPNVYHEYMLEQVKKFDRIAQGDKTKFLKLFDQLKQKVIENPDMLYKNYWK